MVTTSASLHAHTFPSKHFEIRLGAGVLVGRKKQIVVAGVLRCAKQERRGSGDSSVGKSRLFPAQLHPLCLGAWSWDSGGRRRAQCRVCAVSTPLSDAEGALESLIPEQAFWLSCVWAVLLPYIHVGGWLEAGVLHF